MRRLIPILLLLLTACRQSPFEDSLPRDTRAEGFVYVDGNAFALDGEPWFPLMINYKLEGSLEPAHYYGGGTFGEHFREMEAMGFNSVRVCMDIVDNPADTARFFGQLQRVLSAADSAHLRVMVLLKAPLTPERQQATCALLARFAGNSTLWAYDFFNESLYFDPVEQRPKAEACAVVAQWREMMERHAPHQLFTLGFSEPIEVFEWDPSLLPVDSVEIHTYHPMRVASEMYWYARHAGRPWMVGETALPADDSAVAYADQTRFLRQSFQLALDLGACGYGWWEFGDCPGGVNFEARYAGLRTAAGQWKPAARAVASLPRRRREASRPSNYDNMLLFSNICLEVEVRDALTGLPLEGAVVRGWNEDWSVGVNAFSDSSGVARLWSNDFCVHFEASAPGYSHAKFSRHGHVDKKIPLTRREREYQSIPLMEGLSDTLFFRYPVPPPAHRCRLEGGVALKPLRKAQRPKASRTRST